MRLLGMVLLLLLVVLHQDFWLWDRNTIVLGLPVGLTYHVGLCLVAAGVFWILTRTYLGQAEEDPS